MSYQEANSKTENVTSANWVDLVQRRVKSLRYGVVQIVVHDSQVTQVETTERVRLDKPSPAQQTGK
jgi:hypothetical protein